MYHTFKFQKSLYKGCHDILMKSIESSYNAVIIVKDIVYLCIIYH